MTNKLAEIGKYLCSKCNTTFEFKGGDLICPGCQSRSRLEIVLINIKNDPKEEEMYSEDDFHGG